ncbi:HAMP domain-containing histidine kinase [Calothrix sp. FACHB-156]|nr:HAMP domain-containing histidine kinase [Calothrix sp. FACHB-156]
MMIQNKIIFGYAVVLSIAVVGTIAGLTTGNYYQQQALQERKNASDELKFLSNLQVQILYNRPAKQLSPYLTNQLLFRRESNKFIQRLKKIRSLLKNHYTLEQHTHNIELESLLYKYEKTLATISQHAKFFVEQVEPLTTSPKEKIKAEQALVNFVKSPEFVAFIEFPEQLQSFYELAHQREVASVEVLTKAEALRTQIILLSLVLSIIIAIALTLYTSRAIALPIQKATKVARQINQESNFDLQIPIISNDEVGILADAMNQLIVQVKHLLAEINQKNIVLQEALQTLNHQQIQLIQAEKMLSLGQLVAGIAHEINNPVNFIHGNLTHIHKSTQDLLNFIQLFQNYYPHPVAELQIAAEEIDLKFLQEDLPKIIASMELGTERISQIVLSLRNFSRIDEADLKAVDIHQGIDNTLMILQHRIQSQTAKLEIQIIQEYSHLPLVECYAGELNQVFINILNNAIDALEQRYHQETVKEISINPPQIIIKTRMLNEHWIEIAIADNGCGIPLDIQKLIFDPFFTTKSVGKGTGIGMSISYYIITEKHRGKLEFFSTPGKETEFFIQIPIGQKQPQPACEANINALSLTALTED